METTIEKAKRIIADALGVEVGEVTPGAYLQKDLGADSLDVVDLIMILEKEFNISIPDEQIEHMKQVRHLTDYLSKVKPLPVETLQAQLAA